MGSGASASGLTAAISSTPQANLRDAVGKLDEKQRARLLEMLSASTAAFLSCDVSAVPQIEASKLEEFKEMYIDSSSLGYDSDEGKKRLEAGVEIQFTRWEWVQNNKDIYVNMLRVSGFSDPNIQDCLDGKRALCFVDPEIHSNFIKGLTEVACQIEKDTGWKKVRFALTGSAVPGFSQNPMKGKRDIPTKITSVTKSDLDVVLVAEGGKQLIEDRNPVVGALRPHPATCTRTGPKSMRYGLTGSSVPEKNVDLASISPKFKEWFDTWSPKFFAGIQFTLQEDAGAQFPPWEYYIV